MKPINGRRQGGRGRGDKKVIEGVNVLKVYYMHVWKYHSETPLQDQNMLIKYTKYCIRISFILTAELFGASLNFVCEASLSPTHSLDSLWLTWPQCRWSYRTLSEPPSAMARLQFICLSLFWSVRLLVIYLIVRQGDTGPPAFSVTLAQICEGASRAQ
jgi:hypothetical protein